ncbi:DUF3253 domain-containing protein [[Mycobacterium] wendilense]|uniref:DUF3253 domain-containing protein n=1 Tax=[Mycobacterium] wendilense TaxID=3064284 RepID=A0ABM9MDS7_9MYCO|nr:DUF3253 domain-containing protein [Mycolicibacterium sp. MU0050]CAJ1582817.1 DUF3253 domain-containing protein [Mycolicibacterium sp. MU0050]
MSEQLRAELRKASSAGGPAASDADIALGTGAPLRRLESAMRALAEHRGPDGSTCPSDAARAVGGDTWRELMDDARDIARRLAKAGELTVTQGDRVLDPDLPWRGPVRLRAADPGGRTDDAR